MKIECLILLVIVSVSSAMEFNETTTAIAHTTIPVVTKNKRIIKEFNYTDPETLQTCSMMVRKFPGGYLRGVKYPYTITVNGTMSLKECHARCCFEERFECKSYSYFVSLKQCFLMNVTKNYEKAELIYFADWIHFQVMTEEDFLTTSSPEEETTIIDEVTTEELDINSTIPTTVATTKSLGGKETTTLSEDGTTEKYVTGDYESTAASEETTTFVETKSTENNVELGPNDGTFDGDEDPSAGKIVSCPLGCSGHGKCETSVVNDDGDQTVQTKCRCEKGYEGEGCERDVEEKVIVDVFQPWMIAVIVIGILILILIVIACVLWRLYKQKGEYRVVDYIRRWTRRDKKPAKPDNPDEIAHMDGSNDTYPTIGRGNNGFHEESTRTAV